MPEDEYHLEIVEASQDTAEFFVGETPIEPGVSLRQLRHALGGDEGFMTHPVTGEPVPVSLAPWADADPDTTIIRIGFTNRRGPGY